MINCYLLFLLMRGRRTIIYQGWVTTFSLHSAVITTFQSNMLFCDETATGSAVYCVETALLNCAMTCTEDNGEDFKAFCI